MGLTGMHIYDQYIKIGIQQHKITIRIQRNENVWFYVCRNKFPIISSSDYFVRKENTIVPLQFIVHMILNFQIVNHKSIKQF